MQNSDPKNTFFSSKGLILALFIGIALGLFFDREVFNIDLNNSCTSKLNFIKPNLDCEIYDDKLEVLTSLQDKVFLLTDGYKKTGKAKRISVFVRDLVTSRFMGVNENDKYYMASLLKTPVLIGGFKLAEVEPKILDQIIVYNGFPDLYNQQVIKAENPLKVGESYSIRDLMKRSIVYSDNTAAQLLYDFFPDDFLDRIMQALGIQIIKPTGESENLMTARSYANIFRILYNASYLTREYSNEAIDILTKTTFNNGATLKIPKDVVVAHKFAERTLVDRNNKNILLKQFHECGIVYAKNFKEPYTFCILTEGGDYSDLEEAVANISSTIYEDMSR